MKNWLNRAIGLLDKSLNPIPNELDELDWKEDLSPNTKKLTNHLSAFANLPGGGFLVFGVKDDGCQFLPITKDKADIIVETLTNLSRDTLEPHVNIEHSIENYLGNNLLFVHIKESKIKPVHRKSGTIEDSYIRNGGTTQSADRHAITNLLLNSKHLHFEELHVSTLMPATEVLESLDYKTIFKLLNTPNPLSETEIITLLHKNKMIDHLGNGIYITNFGALAAAYDLTQFDNLARKAVRVIKYKGKNKVETEREYPGTKGYAIAFENLISFLQILLPKSEIIQHAFREERPVYPEIALRELVANALIHQDLTIKGAGPMIEIFEDRVEISNPGKLLPTQHIDRLIRTTPHSRNEILANAFRRYKICEERGSGLEKSVIAIELFGLPPLKFEEFDNFFRVTLYSPKSFADLSPSERVEAAYQHSIIKYYSSGGMTNTSLRERFKMPERQRSQISIVIREALEQRKIKPKNPDNTSTKFAEYIPFWG